MLEKDLDEVIRKYEAHVPEGAVPAWILPPLSCKFLQEVAAHLPVGSMAFEFGSGRSTHALRRVSAGTASVEHSAEWLNKTEESDESLPKREKDYSAVVPLRRLWSRFRLIESFPIEEHPQVVERLKEARLILVDSPPNPAKREHALFLAMRYAPIGAVIVLDDLEIRATARFAHRLARQNRKQFRFWPMNIDHQLGVFLKLGTGRIRSRPSLIEFVGTWLRV